MIGCRFSKVAVAAVAVAWCAVSCVAADAKPLVVGVAEQWLGGMDGREKSPQAGVREEYAEAIRRGGNIPVVVCRTSETGQLARAIASLDILILPGGVDVEPWRYGEEPAPRLERTLPDCDDFDFALLDAALARKLPVLGICRGMQVINAYFGGTLCQDLPSTFPESAIGHRSDPLGVRSHAIAIAPGSRLAAATGATNAVVNSRHHQAVDRLAPGFKVTARAPDGVVEAIEHEALPVAGVQFHPEGLVKYADDDFSTRLFANLTTFAGSAAKPAKPAKCARPQGGSFLEGLLAIPSVSSDMEANNEAVQYVKDWLDARGVCTAVVTNEAGRAALYASTVPGKEHDVVFVTHLDVVPPLAEGQFEPRIEGDRIYGRGACDTKGNVAAIVQTLANLAGTCSVGAVFATDEESRSSGTATPVALLEAGFTPKKFIIVGDTNGEFVDSLTYAEKGHFVMRVVARGKGGHSSMPWRADNPVPKLMRAMEKIMELYPEPTADEDHWRDHVTPTKLTGAPAHNIIPDVAEMAFSCRVTSPDSAERIKAQVEEATGLEVILPKKYRLPVLTDPENEYVKSLFAAMRAKWPERDIRLTRMSCATDATRYLHLGLPTVIFGATGGGAHASDEWVSLKSVEDYAAMFTDYLRALPANGATLPPGNWHEPVRAALQRMIDRHVNDPDAYAVFDFDNTCALGDCEHAVLGYMVVGTAASMDGYTAANAAITKDGMKQTMNCKAPLGCIVDGSKHQP